MAQEALPGIRPVAPSLDVDAVVVDALDLRSHLRRLARKSEATGMRLADVSQAAGTAEAVDSVFV